LVVIDTSAIIAIALLEEEAERFSHSLAITPGKLISAATRFECASVIMTLKPVYGLGFLDDLLADTLVDTIAFDASQLSAAIEARRKFGRGAGHRAALNMGDCFSYALAKSRNLPLLFKGNDFIHTDIRPALHLG
jgi:ribonuclease VapC